MPRTQVERTKATTGQLIKAARGRFVARGYRHASIEEIVRAAGVTRGALYHHFASKLDVFRAVVEAEHRALASLLVKGSASEKHAWERFRTGCRLFLDACLDPSMRRILLLDGPAVLGFEAVREIEAQYTLALLREGLRAAADEGRLVDEDIETLAQLLFAVLAEGGRLIARARRPRQALPSITAAIDRLLDGVGAGRRITTRRDGRGRGRSE